MSFQSDFNMTCLWARLSDEERDAGWLAPMTDILDRLRARVKYLLPGDDGQLLQEAIAEIERLRRGEFICTKCGLRKNSEHEQGDF